MKKLKIISTIACFFVLMSFGFPVEAAIRIVSPQEDVWVSTDTVQVVGMLEGETDTFVKVKVKRGKLLGSDKSPVMNGAFSVMIKLKTGKNQIIIKSGKSKAERNLYLAVSEKDIPEGLKRYYVHPLVKSSLVKSSSCDTCHQLKGRSPSYKKIIPTTANCTTGDCHTKICKDKYIHGPIGAKICVFCHNPHGSVEPKAVSRAGVDLCVSCHEEERKMFSEKVIMAPVKEGCIACHHPHESSQKFQLRGSSLEGLCFTCHDKQIKNRVFLHGPIKKGECIACHLPHSSPYKGLLAEKNEKFCYICHKERLEEFQRKFSHKPIKDDCNSCHTAHGSNVKFQLKEKEPKLCYSCHKKTHPEVIKEIKSAKFPHRGVTEGKCSACHTVHSTDFQKQLKAPLKDICFVCHTELKEEVASSNYQHGAVKESNCNACHKSHGANHAVLLNKAFPQEFYTPYSPVKYAMCFECHNPNICKDEKTLDLTNFRNASTNLHYLHVNRKKGRSCKACHEVHAGDQIKHIRAEVPFGMWSYPIQFTSNKNGGSCVVGCHKPRSYSRDKFVKN
jgi:predicted CXXCH cytochrome family protein